MAQQIQIKLTGVLSGTAAPSAWGSSGFQDLLPIEFCQTCAGKQNDTLSNLVSSSGSPFPIPFGTITKARVVALRVLAGTTVNVTITTTAKGPATFPVSGLYIHLVQNPGDEITAITLDTSSQAIDVAYLVAGDVS